MPKVLDKSISNSIFYYVVLVRVSIFWICLLCTTFMYLFKFLYLHYSSTDKCTDLSYFVGYKQTSRNLTKTSLSNSSAYSALPTFRKLLRLHRWENCDTYFYVYIATMQRLPKFLSFLTTVGSDVSCMCVRVLCVCDVWMNTSERVRSRRCYNKTT